MLKTIKKIINWVGPNKNRLYISFFYSFLINFFTAVPILLSAYVLDLVVLDYKGIAIFNSDWIYISFLVIVATVIGRYIFDYKKSKIQDTLAYELVAEDRIKIGEMLKKVSLGYFSDNNTGSILNTITMGIGVLENLGMRMVNFTVDAYIHIAIVTVLFLFFDYRFAIIVVVASVLSFLCIQSISKASSRNASVLNKSNNKLTAAIVEFTRGLAVAKSFGLKGATTKGMLKSCKDSKDINIKIEMDYTPLNCLNLLILYGATIALILLGFYLYSNSNDSLFYLISIVFCSFSLFLKLIPLSDSAHVFTLIDESFKQINKLEKTSMTDKNERDINIDKFDIQYKNVKFKYKDKLIINDFNLDIKENDTVAIVGPSGSGKSTLCNLLSRFYKVNAGEILLNNHNINDFTQDSLLKNISMVFQNVYLMNDTIYNNIGFGLEGATKEEIIQAAKQSRCHDFIMSFEKGYDTIVGEGGNNLSGGQKQRISIARALLKDAPIIILDEATASIDPENEELIQDALHELTKHKTVLVIAHRLATITKADKIVFIENGKLVECGSHEDLIKKRGKYFNFIDIKNKSEKWVI